MKIHFSEAPLSRALDQICRKVAAAGGRCLVVGGAVRDSLLRASVPKDGAPQDGGLGHAPAHDLDLEVYGLDPERLCSLLDEDFDLDLVGQSFGVLKIRHLPIDVAIPRRESKHGLGHKGFEVHSDPGLSVAEAAERRDFTMNAISWDPLTEEILDPTGGTTDLEQRVLRHVSEKFSEDPLRVLRGAQFAARFKLDVASETVELCRRVEPEGLARERIFEEWKKLVVRGLRPSAGLNFLRDCGWIRYFPEVAALIDCPQDPEWHPEGDVWVHTLHVLDAFADERLGDEWEDLVVGLACLCHDLGKPATTEFIDGRIRSRGHEEEGEGPTRAFLERLTNQEQLAAEVVPLVREHLKPTLLFLEKAGPAAVRRLARRVGRIDRLVRVGRADHQGRPPLPFDGFPAGDWLLEKAAELRVESQAPRALVMGRHLMEMGLQPGAHFKPLLDACFEAQLDGKFSDLEGGLEVARQVVAAFQEKTSAGEKTLLSGKIP